MIVKYNWTHRANHDRLGGSETVAFAVRWGPTHMRTFKNMMKMTLGAYIEMNLHNLPKIFSLAQTSPMCYTQ